VPVWRVQERADSGGDARHGSELHTRHLLSKEAAIISPRSGALAVEGSNDARTAVDEYLRTSTASIQR
jgi:hypothetical protein